MPIIISGLVLSAKKTAANVYPSCPTLKGVIKKLKKIEATAVKVDVPLIFIGNPALLFYRVPARLFQTGRTAELSQNFGQIFFRGADSGQVEFIDQNAEHAWGEESRQRRPDIDILDPQGQQG